MRYSKVFRYIFILTLVIDNVYLDMPVNIIVHIQSVSS